MTLTSLANYAKMHGASAQAATKWRAKGHVLLRDGKVDVEASDRLMQAAGLGKFGDRVSAPHVISEAEPPVDTVVDALVDAGLADSESGLRTFIASLLAGKIRTHAEAAALKENALAFKHSIEALKAAGALVEADIAQKVLFEGSRAARDQWLNFPAKYGPKLAADLKLEPGPVVEALTAHVHRQIEELGEPDADFTSEPD